MASPSLGVKRHCQSCGQNYYDLNKSPIVCPHCQAEFDPEVLLKSRRAKPVAQVASKKVEAVENEEEIDTDLEAGIDDADAPIEGEDDLGDDSDLAVIAPAESSDDDIEVAAAGDAIEDELDAPDEAEEI